jgi:hypothetical protein
MFMPYWQQNNHHLMRVLIWYVMPRLIIKVETYSGYTADERPVSFIIREKNFTVEEIMDRWYGEEHDYFKLKADDAYTYIIRYDRTTHEWELVKMEK